VIAGGVLALGVLAALWLSGPSGVLAQAGRQTSSWTAPKTPWGDPDLQGVWRNEPVATSMERPARFGQRQFMTDQELAEAMKAGPAADPTAEQEEEAAAANARLADQRPRNANETASARPHEKALLGQEYNAWWTVGPAQKGSNNAPWNRTSLIIDPPDGRLPPYTTAALDRLAARDAARKGRGEGDAPDDRNLAERCIVHVLGAGGYGGWAGVQQIIQAPGYIVFVADGFRDTTIIPVDGRPALDDRIRQWMGEPRGRWEGNTLVIETANINDKQDGGAIWPSHTELLPGIHRHMYFGSGTTARFTERLTRVGPNRIEYQYTFTDPSVFVRPFTVLRPLDQAEPDHLWLENACHEGNYGMTSLLSGNRAKEQDGLAAAAAEIETRRQQLDVLRKQTAERLKEMKP
jgi:hypothetical protein